MKTNKKEEPAGMFHVKHNKKIDQYITLLKEYNEHTNVYSKKAYDKLDFHIQDAKNIAELITNNNCNVVDIGSGSGFPSIVLAIINDNNRIFAVESKQKKCQFLSLVKKEMSLNNLSIIHCDINEFLAKTKHEINLFTAKAFGPIEKITKILNRAGHLNTKLIVPISINQFEETRDNNAYAFQTCKIQNTTFYYLTKKE
jgi:16S rRNA (guanine527-N7)-methyltransferase